MTTSRAILIYALCCFAVALTSLSVGAFIWLNVDGGEGGLLALFQLLTLGWCYVVAVCLGSGLLALAAFKDTLARWLLVAALPLLIFAGWLGLSGLHPTFPETRRTTMAEVPGLMKSLQTSDRKGWEDSVDRLAKVGEEVVPTLSEALAHSDPNVRRGAAQALRQMVNNTPTALPELIASLSAPDPKVRAISSKALTEYVREYKDLLPAVPALSKGLADEHREVRLNCTRVFVKIMEEHPEAVVDELPAMVEAIRRPDPLVNGRVAEALGLLGPKARAALPALDDLAKAGEPADALKAAEALWRIGGSKAGGAARALPLLGHRHEGFRVAAANLLGRMGADAVEAIPALERAEADAVPRVREAVRAALVRIRTAKDAVHD